MFRSGALFALERNMPGQEMRMIEESPKATAATGPERILLATLIEIHPPAFA
ncbi:MAG TPA: hypothetical protein VNW97_21900 [Candidatus Saccharimonadales bacterium]|nr:hypothetical protein [Candidatus Saccharimonadales bacterium]